MSSEPNSSENTSATQAVDHVAEAHRRLSLLRQQLDAYPDLEVAIERLEMALSILTTKTGGML
jgi:hypothetical protein